MASSDHPKVAYLGPKASYTHQAAQSYFPSNTTLHAVSSIPLVFTSVQSQESTYGVVPIENSSNGSVQFTLDVFANLPSQHPDILVCAEIYVPVHHCLVGRLPENIPKMPTAGFVAFPGTTGSATTSGSVTPTPAHPGSVSAIADTLSSLERDSPAKLDPSIASHIRTLHTHPQAWGQCKTFLQTYFPHTERLDAPSTSRAAAIVAQDATCSSAAISSEIAAEVHGLDILARSIEDRPDNVTRFLVLRRKDTVPPEASNSDEVFEHEDEDGIETHKSLISFTVPHSDPGALSSALAVFAPYKLNLTSINTRPSGLKPWHYVFFVEITGRRRREDGEGAVNGALRELDSHVESWHWLGSWKRVDLPKS